EESRRRHHLSGLAIAALHDVFVDPGLLHGVQPVRGEALDGRDRAIADGGDGHHARPRGAVADVHGAGAALGHPAAELGAGEAEDVPQHPEQRHVLRHIDVMVLAVDSQSHVFLLVPRSPRRGPESSKKRQVPSRPFRQFRRSQSGSTVPASSPPLRSYRSTRIEVPAASTETRVNASSPRMGPWRPMAKSYGGFAMVPWRSKRSPCPRRGPGKKKGEEMTE